MPRVPPPSDRLPLAAPPASPAGAAEPPLAPRHALGVDAGGTATRWAVATAGGRVVAEGEVGPLAALQLGSADGDAAAQRWLDALMAATQPWRPWQGFAGGFSGLGDAAADALRARLTAALDCPPAAVRVVNDLELACRSAFEPGRGIVVVAGTGSIAGHLDAGGRLHRAGGRGALIDDAGSAHWIAARALRHVWRAEDAAPGSGTGTALGRCLAQGVGGADWDAVRRWLRDADRGAVGRLATAVARAAAEDGDPAALALLQAAGRELARLVHALQARVGAQPLACRGGAWRLHPVLGTAFEAALPPAVTIDRDDTPAHRVAAGWAAARSGRGAGSRTSPALRGHAGAPGTDAADAGNAASGDDRP